MTAGNGRRATGNGTVTAERRSFWARFVPDRTIERLTELDLGELRAQGVTSILLDLDNTIAVWRSLDVPEDIGDWIARAKRDFRVCIVSNTSRFKRLSILRERLGIECVGFAQKPWGFRHSLRKLGVDPAATVVIGDQLLTDVFGGNLAEARTILVKPVSNDEFIGTYATRLLERFVLWLLRRRGLYTRPW